jgi:hypothetical protein
MLRIPIRGHSIKALILCVDYKAFGNKMPEFFHQLLNHFKRIATPPFLLKRIATPPFPLPFQGL